MNEALAQGRGAASLDGKMIDMAHFQSGSDNRAKARGDREAPLAIVRFRRGNGNRD